MAERPTQLAGEIILPRIYDGMEPFSVEHATESVVGKTTYNGLPAWWLGDATLREAHLTSFVGIPEEERLLGNAMAHGLKKAAKEADRGRAISGAMRKAEDLSAQLERLGDSGEQVAIVEAIRQSLKTRRGEHAASIVDQINAYLARLEASTGAARFWEVLSVEDAGFDPEAGDPLYKLARAPLVGIDFTDTGEVISLLRRNDGEIGYRVGSQELFAYNKYYV